MNLPLLRSCKPGFAEGCFLGCLEKAVFAKQESPTGTKQRCNCGHNLDNDGASGPMNASLYHYQEAKQTQTPENGEKYSSG